MASQAPENSQNFARTLEDLSDEAEMADGQLYREMLDQLYLRRSIEPDDVVRLEKILRERGFEIHEKVEPTEKDISASNDGPVSYANAIDQLIATAKRVPLLTADEEAAHGEAIQRAALLLEKPITERSELENRIIDLGRKSFDALVHHNVRLVTSFVFDPKYRYRHDIDDMVQMGLLGLMRAAERFDPSLGYRFSTYAMWWIRQGVLRGIANDAKTIRLPVHMIDRVAKFKRAQRALGLSQSYSGNVISRIAESLGWTTEFTARVSQIAEMKMVSFETPLGSDPEFTLGDTIPDRLPDPEDIVVENDTAAHVREILEELPDERHRDIIKRRFGLDGPEETLESIGQSYGVTRERIRQLESKALKHLKLKILRRRLKSLVEH